MQGWHWLTIIAIAVGFYILGSKYPGLVSKATMGKVSA